MIKKIILVILKIIIGLLLTYAILFSIAGTYALLKAYKYITAPINEVKLLKGRNPDKTAYMEQYSLELKQKGKSDTLVQTFVSLDSISPYLQEAVLAAEDDGFYIHPGFDLEAMISANEYNLRCKKIKRGGSTISQQTAKNLFLTNDRNFERKYKELAYTLLMEKFLGKKRILELYLNYAQWGSNLFGCEAASQFYFKKPCSRLNRFESIRLAAILSSPARLNPLNSKSTILTQRVQVIANNLYSHHQINDSGYQSITGFPPVKDSTTFDSSTATPDSLESIN